MARLYDLTTPLGQDVLLFRSMRGREELARLSEFRISTVSTRGDINPGDLLAKGVTVKQELRNDGSRYFHGYVTRFAQGAMVGRFYGYELTVRPWLWFLTRTADCRIFQQKTVPDIVKEVFADHPVAVYEDGLTGKYAQREYCVQYRETDFDFVSRLLEEEGIYYYFEHSDGRHVMKLVDSYSGHKALPQKATIAYYPPGTQVRVDDEFIHSWTFEQRIQPGVVALDDYDFTKPKVDLAVKAKVAEKHDQAEHEVFDWPGEYIETGDGDYLVRARIDELHADFDRAEAACNVREIAVGRLFNLTNMPRRDQEREYLIVSADYDLRDNAYESAPEEPSSYHCAFSVLQSRQQFRPARLTPRPTVKGLHSAVVVGPAGEEIWTDKYGRVKVQFHWDRYGKKDENSSCWMRVCSPWAGGTWGAISLPRIGHEVMIDFLEGDPDQPIVVGRVYNADQMPPYALPANKTQSGVKSRSSLRGGPANFNEFRFEDKKGSEQVYLHAEKNQDIVVENDESHSVGHDRSKSIGHDETTSVGNNRTETVGVNESITIGANRTEKVGSNETITIGVNRTEQVGSNESITIGANRTKTVALNEVATVGVTRTHSVGVNEAISVGAAQQVTVGATRSVSVGQSQSEQFGTTLTTNVGTDRTTSIGKNSSTTIGQNCTTQIGQDESRSIGKNLKTQVGDDETRNVGKKLHITAGDEIVLTCGSSVITMKKDGTITIKGKDITIDAMSKIDEKAVNITSEASAKSMTKGSMVNVEASGINTIKGSLVKIN